MAYLKAIRGDTERYDITLADAAGDPLDLDTVTEIWFTVRAGYDRSTPAIEKTMSGGGITVTDADAGTAQITIEPADTEDFPGQPVSCPFDVQVLSAGEIATAIRGRLRISPDVTTAIS